MSLREEIKEIVLVAIDESVGYAFEGKIYNPRITDIMNDIVSIIEKRIDLEIKPPNDMEYHCYAAFNYATEKVKELLK